MKNSNFVVISRSYSQNKGLLYLFTNITDVNNPSTASNFNNLDQVVVCNVCPCIKRFEGSKFQTSNLSSHARNVLHTVSFRIARTF